MKVIISKMLIYPTDILDIVLSYEINTSNNFIDIVIWLVHTCKKYMFFINYLAGNESFQENTPIKIILH